MEKSNLFAYLRFCVFCRSEEKKIEKKKKEKIEKSPQDNIWWSHTKLVKVLSAIRTKTSLDQLKN